MKLAIGDLGKLHGPFAYEYGPGAPDIVTAMEALVLGNNPYQLDLEKIELAWGNVIGQICLGLCATGFSDHMSECFDGSEPFIEFNDGPAEFIIDSGHFIVSQTVTFKVIISPPILAP
ncbi:MAG TPA: hypothetical protein DHV25_00110 [Candidatus Kerfeldbacteria bacterium]|nr:MAG: hypothetical protein UY52_C0014G0013 [Parcubacteria group bacterium GW2011_GWC2_49_9]HCJ52113.1 hypothetical protein [Candidatus Kerfeldbacteria bacterium]